MFEFVEYIKQYIQERFNSDKDFSSAKTPKVLDAYQVNHEISSTKPEIQVHILDNNENGVFTSFCGKNANNIPLQITAYSGQIKIAGKDRNAKHSSIILGDKLEKIIYELVYARETDSYYNKNIYSGRATTTSPPIPINDGGTIYATAIRFDFIVASPYVVD